MQTARSEECVEKLRPLVWKRVNFQEMRVTQLKTSKTVLIVG